jgi:sigma-B regulation protein RsbU (phosphoserine phosphatase)
MNPLTSDRDPIVSAAGIPSVESFLLEVADVVNTTLDLDTLLQRVAELVRRVIDYEIFAILLLEPKTQELRVRFSIGHPPEVADRFRLKVGEGITGLAALRRELVLVNDVTKEAQYVGCMRGVRSELAVPLIVKNRVIGVIDIEAPQRDYFTGEHARLLTLIASRIAIGIENARLYTRVSRQARTLGLLFDISRELSSILNLDQLLKRIGERLNEVIEYQMFSILLLDSMGTRLQHRFSMRFNENVAVKEEIPLSEGLVGYAARHKEPVLVADVTKDPRYIMLNPETRTELVVPLIYQDKVIGVLDLEHTRRGYYNEGHVRTMTTLAAQIAIAIENARLYERILQEERRLERDLAMAREIQRHLLPPCCPILTSAQLAARFAPAHTIGGDMYDFLEYSGGRQAIAVGDVSGKGAPAALYAALVSGMLRSTSTSEPSAAEMLAILNTSLNERRIEAHFVALLYAVWDDREHVMQIANSGLPQPIFCRNGKVEMIDVAGLPLGLFEDADYDELTLSAEPGDVFVFFSDGILDARSRSGELFGPEPLEQIVAANCHLSADDLVTAVFEAVNQHSQGVEAFDDSTIVVVKITGDGATSKRLSR